jgi:hypothetical protein
MDYLIELSKEQRNWLVNIPYSAPYLDATDKRYITLVLNSGQYGPNGRNRLNNIAKKYQNNKVIEYIKLKDQKTILNGKIKRRTD